MAKQISIPEEIVEFFQKPGGRSLMVKGGAGTGKTTFALQMLEELAEPDKSFYLSTRVSDDALYTQFPWLKEKEMRGRIIDSSRILLEALYKPTEEEETRVPPEEEQRLETAKEFLKAISQERGPPTKVDRTRLTVLLEQNRMPEIERIYARIEHVLPDKATLVIDSVEGITHKYGIEMEEFVMTMQKDLVENSNTNVVFVLEKPEAGGLEYLVDGLVTLSRGEIDRKRVRHVTLEKLRATEIKQPYYLLTLRNGRFTSFTPYYPPPSQKEWNIQYDKENYYSTGIPDMDRLLTGGFRKGSYNVFEIADNVGSEEYNAVLIPVMLNFLKQERGIIAVLPGGEHPESFKKELTRYVSEELFNKYVRIADYFSATSPYPYVMPLAKTREEMIRTWRENELAIRGKENKPIIEYTGFDALEYIQGDAPAIKSLFSGVARIKVSKDIGIGLLKPGLKVTQEIINMADTYFKILDIDRTPCIYGIKPRTIIYAIVADELLGTPNIKFVPIV